MLPSGSAEAQKQLKERKTFFRLFDATAINFGKESILKQKQTNELGKRGKEGRNRALNYEGRKEGIGRKEFFLCSSRTQHSPDFVEKPKGRFTICTSFPKNF